MLIFFFFNDTATTEIYTLSLHDALPISGHGAGIGRVLQPAVRVGDGVAVQVLDEVQPGGVGIAHAAHGSDADRKSTRLNSSHANISYAVFCLKKKKKKRQRSKQNSPKTG